MQKLLKRTAQAERQVAKRQAKRKKLADRAELRRNFTRRMDSYATVNRMLISARQKQREDWALGPLAPQRDTAIKDEFGAYFGAIPEHLTMASFGDKQLALACKWAGGKKFLCLKPGDRVAIMEGSEKGKITIIRSIDMDNGSVMLDGDLFQRNITVNEHVVKATRDIGRVSLMPLQVPIQAVRLVHPLTDPITKHTRDVIIKELVPRGIQRDKPTGRVTWSRVVPGLNVEIPWPRAFEEEEHNELFKEYEDYSCDTLRIDVDHRSFVPTLLRPPMPSQVIDELRNRYSKFRTRHEEEYVQRKRDEGRAKLIARGKIAHPSMRTPLQELNAKIRAEKKARGQPVLTEAMLINLGKYMAKEDGFRFGGRFLKQVEKQVEKRMAAKGKRPTLLSTEPKATSTAPPPS